MARSSPIRIKGPTLKQHNFFKTQIGVSDNPEQHFLSLKNSLERLATSGIVWLSSSKFDTPIFKLLIETKRSISRDVLRSKILNVKSKTADIFILARREFYASIGQCLRNLLHQDRNMDSTSRQYFFIHGECWDSLEDLDMLKSSIMCEIDLYIIPCRIAAMVANSNHQRQRYGGFLIVNYETREANGNTDNANGILQAIGGGPSGQIKFFISCQDALVDSENGAIVCFVQFTRGKNISWVKNRVGGSVLYLVNPAFYDRIIEALDANESLLVRYGQPKDTRLNRISGRESHWRAKSLKSALGVILSLDLNCRSTYQTTGTLPRNIRKQLDSETLYILDYLGGVFANKT